VSMSMYMPTSIFVPHVVGCVWQPLINEHDDDDMRDDWLSPKPNRQGTVVYVCHNGRSANCCGISRALPRFSEVAIMVVAKMAVDSLIASLILCTPTRKHSKWRSRTSDRESDSRFWIGKPGFLFVFPSNRTHQLGQIKRGHSCNSL